jgi:hypothetical protein
MNDESPKTAEPSPRAVRMIYGEPWTAHGYESFAHVTTRDGVNIANATTLPIARRIVAAVNAMVGIPTAALEQLPGDVETFVAALKAGRNGGRNEDH